MPARATPRRPGTPTERTGSIRTAASAPPHPHRRTGTTASLPQHPHEPSTFRSREGTMKKFVNDPKQYVPEMLKGIALANPDTLSYVPAYNLIMRSDAPNPDKVSIIQGSGSGHEPAHVMTVGRGMLDAACPGDVFSAPPMDYVYETTKLLASPKGVLLLVNNYTGDRMAFEMAQELSAADGVNVKTLFIDDDVAVQDSTYTVGRRGVAGNFFVMKAVGAAAEQGADLDELIRIGEKVDSVTRTMGIALTSCTPPAKGSPLFELGEDEIEVGVGIHGEPGRRRAKLTTANEMTDELLDAVVKDLPYVAGDRVALMINGLGGTPISELYILFGHAHERLTELGITVGRSYVGEYCTSLDMAGASLTLVRLDDEIEALLEAPAEIAARVF
jgi:dihydroxyacetone kinase-like protein